MVVRRGGMNMQENVINAYIESCPSDRQEILNQVRDVIREALPEAEECLKYGMPTYYQKQNLVHFSNNKQHIGFYPTPKAIVYFSEELTPYKTSKGAIQFPVSQAMPLELIRKICLWRLEEVTGN